LFFMEALFQNCQFNPPFSRLRVCFIFIKGALKKTFFDTI